MAHQERQSPTHREDREAVSECADVWNYWPEAEDDKPFGPLRFVAIRIRKRQGELLADGAEAKHFAVVTNVWEWEAKRLLEWHREKAGTLEAIHDVLKNELAAGVLPCSRFGANAAWLRLAVLTHNVITALKRMALPESYLTVRPKRLRFLIFNTAGRILHHARRVLCRIAGAAGEIGCASCHCPPAKLRSPSSNSPRCFSPEPTRDWTCNAQLHFPSRFSLCRLRIPSLSAPILIFFPARHYPPNSSPLTTDHGLFCCNSIFTGPFPPLLS
jgi:hypothetical protein